MTTQDSTHLPDQNDRILAALAHTTVILPMVGLIGAIVIWATQKDKSRFVAFQALQAVAYQLVLVLAYFASMAFYMCSAFSPILILPFIEGSGDVPWLFFLAMGFPFGVLGLMLLLGLAFVVYGLVAAVNTLQGHEFRYVILGCRLERYLQQE